MMPTVSLKHAVFKIRFSQKLCDTPNDIYYTGVIQAPSYCSDLVSVFWLAGLAACDRNKMVCVPTLEPLIS